MNFFKSIISDDADPPKPSNPHESDPDSPPTQPPPSNDAVAGGWGFGGLIKTLAAQSESIIETYRRDLQEFGTGLKKETEVLKDVASRTVKDLPSSIEAGTHHLEGVLKSTAEIISEKAHILASDGDQPETPDTNRRNSTSSGRYSWFDTQLVAIQGDLGTYCEEPEDEGEFREWRLGFVVEDRRKEIEGLVGEDGVLEGVYRRCVPGMVDEETFWLRYFYRVEKLRQQERVRASLVRRAMAGGEEEEEELSWDVDDDEEDGVEVKRDGAGVKTVSDGNLNGVEKGESGKSESDPDVGRVGESAVIESSKVNEKESESNLELRLDEKEVKSEGVVGGKSDEKVKTQENVGVESDEKVKTQENVGVESDEKVKVEENVGVKSDEKAKLQENVGVKSDEKAKLQENVGVKSDEKAKLQENVGVKSNESVGVEGEKSGEKSEEDMGWDEIEDIGSDDEKKISSGNPNRAELRKRLSAAEDDEDLSWDIEDDDEPVKT